MTPVSPRPLSADRRGSGRSTVARGVPRPRAELWEWQLRGACRDLDSAVFFHPENERGARKRARERGAKEVCRSCPVIEDCRGWALAVEEPYGIWGGLSVADRQELIARRGGAAT